MKREEIFIADLDLKVSCDIKLRWYDGRENVLVLNHGSVGNR